MPTRRRYAPGRLGITEVNRMNERVEEILTGVRPWLCHCAACSAKWTDAALRALIEKQVRTFEGI